MKLRKLLQRTAAAAVAGAMALSFSAPALAAVPTDWVQRLELPQAGISPLEAENNEAGEYGITVNGTPVTNVNKENILLTESGNYSLQYVPNENGTGGKLVGIGSLPALDIVVASGAGEVDVELTGGEDAVVDGDLIITNAHDVTILKNIDGTYSSAARAHAIMGSANIVCTGELVINNNTRDDPNGVNHAVASVKGELKAEAGGNVTIIGALSSNADITTIENVELSCVNGNAINSTGDCRLTVHYAANVKVSSESLAATVKNVTLDNCTGTAEFINGTKYTGMAIDKNGSLTVTGSTATYYAGSSASDFAQQSSAEDCLNKKYVKVEMTAAGVTGYGITVNGTAVTDANKDDLPGGLKYDPDTKKLYAENPVEGSLTIVGSSSAEFDVELNGVCRVYEEDVLTDAGNLTVIGAQNVTVTGDAAAIYAIGGKATISNCSGDVTITGSGKVPAVIGDAEITTNGKVIIDGGEFIAVNGALKVENAAGVEVVSSNSDPTVVGNAVITNCMDKVTIKNTGTGMAISGHLTVNGAKGVEVTSASGSPTIGSGTDITSEGDVNITNTSGMAVSTSLNVKDAHDVTVSGKGSPTVGGIADISCSGKVKLTNADYMAFSGTYLKIDGATDVDVEVIGDDTGPAISTSNGAIINCTGNVMITNSADIAVSNGLKVTNAKDVTISSQKSGPTVTKSLDISCSGKVTLTSADYLVFSGTDLKIDGATDVVIEATEGTTSPAISTNNGALIDCTGNVEITNKKGMAVSGSLTVNGAKDVRATGDNGSPAVGGNASLTNCTGNVEITNKYYMAIGGSLTVDGAKDVTVTGNGDSPAVGGSTSLTNCTGNVEITNDSYMAVGGSLTVDGAKDVTVKANSSAPAISGTANITCSGDVTIENAGTGRAVYSALQYTNSAADEKVLRLDGKFIKMLSDGLNDYYQEHSITIRKEYPVTVTNGELNGSDGLYYVGQKVTVTAHDQNASFSKFVRWEVVDAPAGFELTEAQKNSEEITFTMPEGAVELKAIYSIPAITMDMPVIVTDGTINDGTENPLLVKPGEKVTVKAAEKDDPVKFHHWVVEKGTSEDFGLTEGILGSETETGTKEISFIMPQGAVKLTAVYSTPAGVQKNYITVDGGIGTATINGSEDAKAELEIGSTVKVSAEVDQKDYPGMTFDHWEVVYPESFENLPDEIRKELELDLDDSSTIEFAMPKYPVTLVAHWIDGTTPVEPGTDDPADPGFGEVPDSSGIAGAIVAGTAIGGAAVWGGYEITTRVILNDLLPEGAAIPANRGELAMLLWQTAGKPEPAAQPAFADVADSELAKAAQWCVEQGLLDAKDGKFDPDGWMPKFKTIEVWKKAFPNQ